MTENRIEMWLCIVGFGLCMRIFETRPEYMEKKNAEARARYWRNKSNAS